MRVVSPPYLWPLIQPVQFKELQSFRTHTLVITLKALEITDRRKLQGRWGMCTEWYLSAFEHTYKDLVLNPSSKTLKCVYLHNSSSHDLNNYVFGLPDSIIFIKINTLQKNILNYLQFGLRNSLKSWKVKGHRHLKKYILVITHTPVLTNFHTNSKYYELMIWSFLGCLPIDFIQRLYSILYMIRMQTEQNQKGVIFVPLSLIDHNGDLIYSTAILKPLVDLTCHRADNFSVIGYF